MHVGEVVIDTDHAVVFIRGALVSGDQIPRSVAIVCSIRRRKQVEERLYVRVNSDGHARVRSGVAAASRVAGRGQQALMGKRVGRRGNSVSCLNFRKAFKVSKKEV